MSAIDARMATGSNTTVFGGRLLSTLTDWRNTRSTRKSLSRLSDRELDDIGLCRGDIERVARGV